VATFVLGGGQEFQMAMHDLVSVIDTSYVIPWCEYSYYVTLLPCNQFHWGQSSHRDQGAPLGLEPPLAPAQVVFSYFTEVGHRMLPSVQNRSRTQRWYGRQSVYRSTHFGWLAHLCINVRCWMWIFGRFNEREFGCLSISSESRLCSVLTAQWWELTY